MRAGEAQVLAQELDQQGARIDVGLGVLAVHLHGNCGHHAPPLLAPNGRLLNARRKSPFVVR
jgi:hypothetical protein